MANKREFLDGLGSTLAKTGATLSSAAKDLSERASSVYETQKIRARISTEERTIERIKTDIGSLVFSRFEDGEVFEGEMGRLCEEIRQHLTKINTLENQNASIRGKKICPSCRKEVPIDALFCPACGTSCPDPEPIVDQKEEAVDPEYITQVADDEAETGKEPETAGEAAGETAEAFADDAAVSDEANVDETNFDDFEESTAYDDTADTFASEASDLAEELLESADTAAAADEAVSGDDQDTFISWKDEVIESEEA